MADLSDVFNALGTRTRGNVVGTRVIPGSSSQAMIPFINVPPPGESDLGGLGGLISDIVQRLPIPRPRLPAPRRGPTTTGPTFPFPVPIPIPGSVFGNGADCPEQACCKGQHVAKTKNMDDPSFGKCVSNRRMNPLNPKALRRAIRRATRFDSFVKSNRKSLRALARI